MNKYVKNIGISLSSVVIYLLVGMILSRFISNSILMTIIDDIIVSVLGGIYYRKYIYRKERTVKSNKDTWFNLLWITIALWIITQITVTWYYCHFGDQLLDKYNTTKIGSPTLYVCLTLIFAPVAEEILIRGVMYPSLKFICKPWIAALISSAVFSILHGTIVHLIVGMYCGIFFLFVFEYTGKLRYSVLAHIIYNILSLGFTNLMLPQWFFTTAFVIISNILVIVAMVLFALHLRKTNSN